MHARAFAIGIVCGLSLAVVPITFMSYFRWLMPASDTQSTFFKSYNPQAVIEKCACGNIVDGSSGGGDTSHGVGFSSHTRDITANIEIDEENWVPLLQALAADVKSKLLLRGEGGGPGKDTTSRFYYQDGRSLGSVTVPPLVPHDWIGKDENYDRHLGCTPVLVKVHMDEIFVPKLPLDPNAQLARIINRWDRNRHEHVPEPVKVEREIRVIFQK